MESLEEEQNYDRIGHMISKPVEKQI